jgi:hypothetical protein
VRSKKKAADGGPGGGEFHRWSHNMSDPLRLDFGRAGRRASMEEVGGGPGGWGGAREGRQRPQTVGTTTGGGRISNINFRSRHFFLARSFWMKWHFTQMLYTLTYILVEYG